MILRFHKLPFITLLAFITTTSLYVYFTQKRVYETDRHDLFHTTQKPITLLTQFYFDRSNPKRTYELITTLKKNLQNPFIDRVVLLQSLSDSPAIPGAYFNAKDNVDKDGYETDEWELTKLSRDLLKLDATFPTTTFLQKVTIKLITTLSTGGRLLASDAFNYASINHQSEICILSNADIYFDTSLGLLHSSESDLNYLTTYFLSRYELVENEEASLIGTQCGEKFIGSHDAIIFISPLPRKLIQRTRFELGTWGIENRILYEFESMGMKGRNPCKSIKSWHVHVNGSKSSWMPMVNGEGKTAVAFPDTLVSGLEPDFPWEKRRGEIERERRRLDEVR